MNIKKMAHAGEIGCNKNLEKRGKGAVKNEENWCLRRERNRVVLGSWDDCAFQVSLKSRAKPEDPLAVALFHELLPYHCLPHCGVYSPDDYHLACPLATIILPSEGVVARGALFGVLPPDLQQVFLQKPVTDPSLLDVAVLIHSRPHLEGSQDPQSREVNLLYHTWAFQGLDFPVADEVQITMEMGVFCPEGVCETAQEICEELNGVAVGRMGRRIMYMHGASFSPHNAQLRLLDSHTIHSFFSFARHDDGRAVIAYHLLPSAEVTESRLKGAMKDSKTVAELLKNLELLRPVQCISMAVHLISACTI